MYGTRRDELGDYPSGNIWCLFRKHCLENYMREEKRRLTPRCYAIGDA